MVCPKLYQERFILDIMKNFFMQREAKHWKGLSREVVVFSPLKLFKRYVHVALTDMV